MATCATYSLGSSGRSGAKSVENQKPAPPSSFPISRLCPSASKPSWSHFSTVPVKIAPVTSANIETPISQFTRGSA